MSLSIALHSGLSGLLASRSALDVISNNVANTNTLGFTRKIAEQESQILAGRGAGVKFGDIGREVSTYLIDEIREQTSLVGLSRVQDEFFGRIDNLLGTISQGNTLSERMTGFAQALEALSAYPEGTTERLDVIDIAVKLALEFNDVASEIQDLRRDADQEIARTTSLISDQVTNIAELNQKISRGIALQEPVAALQDQRDLAVAKISEQMDVTHFTRGNGALVLMTSTGRVLVDGPAFSLTHTPATAVDAGVTYPGGFDGINLSGTDITGEINSGRLKALIDMRDSTLPDLTAEIDRLAATLRSEINAIHNDGAGFPAANTLTATTATPAGDPFVGTGSVRIGVVDGSGTIVEVLDLALGGLATINDVALAIDGMANASASINGIGRLVISADNAANGIAINEMNSQVGGVGFSHSFGLNDFFVTTSSTSVARNIAVRGDIVANPTLLARGEMHPTNAAAAPGITVGGNTVVQRLADRFNDIITFSAAGGLASTSTTLGGYGAEIVSLHANQAESAVERLAFRESLVADLNNQAASVSGVNVDQEMANLLLYQNAYAASARVINTASEMLDILVNLVR